jgi:hypothetical protein
MGWWGVTTCQAIATTGWLVGVCSGLFLDLVLVALIVSARPYRAGKPASAARQRLQSVLRRSTVALAIAWIFVGWRVGFLACYVPSVALGTAAVALVPLLLMMVTAAQQVGERSVR